MPGQLWTEAEIKALKDEVTAAGLSLDGIESVNVSDAIKTAGADRDKDIDAYIKTLENLGKNDIHLVCYTFMPVFDWTRTELASLRPRACLKIQACATGKAGPCAGLLI